MEQVRDDPGFRDLDDTAARETRLECWEVVMASAVWIASRLQRNAEFIDFLEEALDHSFWIVRWWGYEGLLRVVESTSQGGDLVLAERCGRRASEQLCRSIEPIGLKHRQCALARTLLKSDHPQTFRVMRDALDRASRQYLQGPAKQTFSEGYYETMGASPDVYLSEFFRRVSEISPALA